MRQVFWALAAVMGMTAAAGAENGGKRVFVIATGDEPACLQRAEVAAAIERHVTVQAQALSGPAPAAFDAIEVRVSGGVERPLHIDIRGGGREPQVRDLDGIECPSIPDVVAAFVATAMAPVPQVEAMPMGGQPVPGDSERVRILSESLQPYSLGRYRAGHALLGVLVVGTTAFYLDVADNDHLADALVVGGAGLATIAAITGVAAADRGSANHFAEVVMALGASSMMAGMALSPTIAEDGFSESYALVAAGWLGSALWQARDAIYDPQPTVAELAPIRHQLRTPALRRRMTAGEVEEAELTFRRASWRKRYLVPPMIGAIAGFAVAVREQDEDEHELGMVFAGSAVAANFLMMLVPDPVARFDRRLRDAGLEVKPAPMPGGGGGLAIGGRF